MSNIHNLDLTNNGELVRMIPSLTGSLYKFNGKTIDAIPINADSLLKSSFLYSNDLVIAGSRDVRTYGILAKTGEMLYECNVHGCDKSKSASDFDDIVLIERSTVTVRAHEPRNGNERWNFSVGSHNIKIPQPSCVSLDGAINNLNLTAILPKGILTARTLDGQEVLWKHGFESPIVKVWRWDGKDLHVVNFFNQAKKPTMPLSPAIYLGMHHKQLYIYESDRIQTAINMQIHMDGNKDKNALTIIPWKPISANEIEDSSQPETTALSVLYSSAYINGNGYYLYTENDIKKGSTILCGTNFTRIPIFSGSYESNYWKQIFIVSLITIVVLKYFFNLGWRSRQSLVNISEIKSTSPETENKTLSTENWVIDFTENEYVPPFKSRFLEEFEIVNCLGRGGFGVVFQVKQKIDEYNYAIKRIALPRKKDSNDRVLREVKALAKLDHSNIVRYSTSWMENPPPNWNEFVDKKWVSEMFPSSMSEMSKSTTTCTDRLKHNAVYIPSSESDSDIVFENSQEKTEDNTQDLSVEKSEMSEETELSCSDQSNSQIKSNISFLYIQMQLCQKNSLREWLLENTKREVVQTTSIYNQILNAVEYVHKQKLIHRDLKPSNIFFAQDDTIKVGDFGLVTSMKNVDNDFCKSGNTDYTKGAGTYFYMSPEQVNGEEYDHKVDIFSLGVILFELIVPLTTDMERHHCLTDLRKEIFPPDFHLKHENEYKLMKMMLSQDPEQRPEVTIVKEIFNADFIFAR
ncbi:PREDICTED: eukaryotic translation initiation factor 2-alpha kinase-like isoform X2 [Nicrophorus vespilloides]|nr:PREDICTED: eukaryotic translation initiation factor 2-alpha kinase-like isoform X2 [Nicrophorus vespilloides]